MPEIAAQSYTVLLSLPEGTERSGRAVAESLPKLSTEVGFVAEPWCCRSLKCLLERSDQAVLAKLSFHDKISRVQTRARTRIARRMAMSAPGEALTGEVATRMPRLFRSSRMAACSIGQDSRLGL